MLDRKYFRDLSKGATVEEMIEILKEYPPKSTFTVLGDPNFYIHMDSDNSEVIVDDNPLDRLYVDAIHKDDFRDNLKDLIKNTGVPKEMLVINEDEAESMYEDMVKLCEMSIKKK